MLHCSFHITPSVLFSLPSISLDFPLASFLSLYFIEPSLLSLLSSLYPSIPFSLHLLPLFPSTFFSLSFHLFISLFLSFHLSLFILFTFCSIPFFTAIYSFIPFSLFSTSPCLPTLFIVTLSLPDLSISLFLSLPLDSSFPYLPSFSLPFYFSLFSTSVSPFLFLSFLSFSPRLFISVFISPFSFPSSPLTSFQISWRLFELNATPTPPPRVKLQLTPFNIHL